MKVLTFALVLRRMSALPKALLLVNRLGGSVTYLSAADGRANVVVRAPRSAAHRFAPQLRRIVDVMELRELRMVGAAEQDAPGPADRRRHRA
ncbi:MAG: hypothetical protein GY778_04560 [bacterium]|nr:hypothetical protein [bacterium]